jgi:TolB-like protein
MLAVALAGAGLLALPHAAVAAGARVALLPIVVHSADAEPGYLKGGLAEMLSARLEQSGRISVIRLETGERSTTRLSVALQAARAARADFVVFGSFTQFGDGASLDVRCASVGGGQGSGRPPERTIFIHSGTVAEIIPKLDELAEKISRYVLGEPEAAPASSEGSQSMDSPDPVAAAPPTGVDSYEDLLRRVDALERAVYSGAAGQGAEAGPSTGGGDKGEGQGADAGPAGPSNGASPLR